MKKCIVTLLLFSFLALSGDLIAQKRKKGEVSLGGGVFFADGGSAFGAISLGYLTPFVGLEMNGAILEGGGLIGGNLSVGPFTSQVFIPYVTGGIWTTTEGGSGFNVGAGVRVKLTEAFALRAEYRRYIFGESDWGLNAVIGAISYFF
jgi:opacity protein-like surface antigen